MSAHSQVNRHGPAYLLLAADDLHTDPSPVTASQLSRTSEHRQKATCAPRARCARLRRTAATTATTPDTHVSNKAGATTPAMSPSSPVFPRARTIRVTIPATRDAPAELPKYTLRQSRAPAVPPSRPTANSSRIPRIAV